MRSHAPLPVEPWADIRDATQEGSPCLHIDPLTEQIVGAEDCLFLNVFTRRLPDKPRAVLVWIHGGGFTEGTGNVWGPEPFMEHDVVLVTFNYRLGPLGFLSLGTNEVPGNAGLKDQTMALRWVKENIAVFGGDPQNVTIFGESAGGASVHLHLLSPLSKGLFHRAIMQSGSALCPWVISRDPVGRAKRLAMAAGFGDSDPEDLDALYQWFREAPAVALVLALEAARSTDERRRGVVFTFVPVVETPLPGAFLTRSPDQVLEALLTDHYEPLPAVVFGLNPYKGLFMLPAVPTPEALKALDIHFENVVPFDLLADRSNSARTQEVCQSIKDFYFNGNKLSMETLASYMNMTTDTAFSHPVTLSARAHYRLGSPVYMYQFAFVGRLNILGRVFGEERVRSTCHADELGYLFHVECLPRVEDDSPEARVRRRMVRMWVDFAHGGNPTPNLDEEITQKWEQFSEAEPNYLSIDEELTASSGLFKERIAFWDDLYKSEGTGKAYLANPNDSIIKQSHREPIKEEIELRLPRDFTLDELKKFNGTQADGRIFVCVKGNVYDVTEGKLFYGTGGPYSVLAGRDASRALVTFTLEINEDGYDDLSDLSPTDLQCLREWDLQFQEKYECVGHLLRPGEQPTNYS